MGLLRMLAAFCLALAIAGAAGKGSSLSGRLDGDLSATSLSAWTKHAFTALPCLDDLDLYDSNALLYNEYSPAPLDGKETIIPSWRSFRRLLTEFLHLQKAELHKFERWPLDSKDGYAQKVVPNLFSLDAQDEGSSSSSVVLPSILKLLVPKQAKVAFFGDLHGAVHSFIRELRALQRMGYLNDDLSIAEEHRGLFFMVFCGDYVDRGIYGVETIALLLALRLKNPQAVFMVRGNHEDKPMNDQPGSGGFSAELQRKFPDAFTYDDDDGDDDGSDAEGKAEEERMAQVGLNLRDNDPFSVVWKLYETLPVALFVGVMPDADDKANGTATTAAAITADGVLKPSSSGDTKKPVSYIMAVHGGIEPGVDLFPFLHQTATAASSGTGPVIQYAALRALRRADWVATRNQTVRSRLTSAAVAKLQNWGDDHHHGDHGHDHHHHDGDVDHWPVSFARHRKEGGRYPSRTQKVGRYPAALLETDPALGFCWFDFTVTRTGENGDNDGYLYFSDGRGFIFGRDLVQHWLEDNGIAAIFRAHQHNDSPRAGPMLTNVRKNQGMFDNWGGSGMVVTMLSGGHIPALDFVHDSFGLLSFGGSHSPKKWRLSHCRQRNGKQFVYKGAGSSDVESADAWAWGRVPPADMLALAAETGKLSPNTGNANFCDPDVTRAKCHLQRWTPGGWTGA